NQLRSLKPTVSTTSVSPSHLPTECPFHVGSGSFGWLRPSRNICRNGAGSSLSWNNIDGVCTNLYRRGELGEISPGRQNPEGESLKSLANRSFWRASAQGRADGCSRRGSSLPFHIPEKSGL